RAPSPSSTSTRGAEPMEASRAAELAWERRWARPTTIACFASIIVFIASVAVASSVGATGEAEGLRSVHEHGSTITISSLLQAVAFLLLAAPLSYLFRAALAPSRSMRRRFVPLVVVAPNALSIGA